ncbi:MAG: TRAP transporter TatT component family protein [Bacteriovorax sp.]|nr:TRAP transporter TatT component family protein [Bacteriovorax sp.]
MKRPCPILYLVLVCLVMSSCSINKIAVNSSSGLLYSASNEVEAETNFELFKLGVPGNLLLMEGLLSESPENLDILATLTKGYAGYAFAINETEMYNEEWGELKTEVGKSQALFNYTRAFNFGLRYLKINKIELNDLISKMNEPQGIAHFLEKRLSADKKDLDLVLFTAQSFAALINLQKDNISMVAQLPVAKAMFDWVCMKDPKINYGTCDILYAAFEAGRPKMLGGNPEKGKEIFLCAISNHPHNWLIRTSYMQYYLIPQNDQEGFLEQLQYLKNKQVEFQSFHIYSAGTNSINWNQESRLRFYQTLALKRFELMNKYQKQFF